MKAIVDTDILSAFGKAKRVNILNSLFSKIFIAPAVLEELLEVQRIGFSFAKDVFKLVKILPLGTKSLEQVRKFLILYPQLGRGEIESMVLAISTKSVILTNDAQAKKVCKENSVDFLDLEEILRALKTKEILTREELKELIEIIEKEDKTIIKAKNRILKE